MSEDGIRGLERAAFIAGYLEGADAATPWTFGTELSELEALQAWERRDYVPPFKSQQERIDELMALYGSLGPIGWPG